MGHVANKEWEFDFSVSGISRETAEKILYMITEVVETFGGVMAGGFFIAEEEGQDGEKDD